MFTETASYRNRFVAMLGGAAVACAAAAASAQTPSTGSGQAYPSRPVEFIVHVNPGG